MYVDLNRLKGKFVAKGLSLADVAQAIDISMATMYRRMAAGGDEFTVGQAQRMAKLLDMTAGEINEIFFAQKVA